MQCLQKFNAKGRKIIHLSYGHSTLFGQSWKTQLRLITQLGPLKLSYDVYNDIGTDASKPPVIITHDIFGCKKNWIKVARNLNQRSKRKIYVTDARNHGRSPDNAFHDSETMSDDIHRFVSEENLQRVAVIGHSMGGMAMIYFIMKHPDLVEKAFIMDISPATYPKDFKDMRRILLALQDIKIPNSKSLEAGRAIAERVMKKVVRDDGLVEFVNLNLKKGELGEFTWRCNIQFLLGNFDNMIDATHLNYPPCLQPVLFVGSTQSRFIGHNELPQIKKFFPNAKLEWVNCGHLIHREAPEVFVNKAVTFLNKEHHVMPKLSEI